MVWVSHAGVAHRTRSARSTSSGCLHCTRPLANFPRLLHGTWKLFLAHVDLPHSRLSLLPQWPCWAIERSVLEPPGNRGGIKYWIFTSSLLTPTCDGTNRSAGIRGWWSRRRLPVHRATACAHFTLKREVIVNFSPPLSRQKRRAHVRCPDLLGRCSRMWTAFQEVICCFALWGFAQACAIFMVAR